MRLVLKIDIKMVKWICSGCDFRFESENPKGCPYCGRDTLEKEPDASELLDEVERLLED